MASLTVEALRPFLLSEFLILPLKPRYGLRDWIRQDDFQVYDAPKSNNNFYLSYADEAPIFNSLGFDCNRFILSSIETFYELENHPTSPLRNSLAWPVIKSYYSSFYAAHALLRLFGVSCSQIDTSEISRINKVAAAYLGKSPNLIAGYYIVKSDNLNKKLEFTQSDISRRPHQLLWWQFDTFLVNSIKTLATDSSHYQPIMLRLQSLRDRLTNNGKMPDGNWLSQVRDDVNYRHGHSAWYPYGGTKKRWERVAKVTDIGDFDSLDFAFRGKRQAEELDDFFLCCSYIVGLCREICVSIYEAKNDCFLKNTSMKLINILDF